MGSLQWNGCVKVFNSWLPEFCPARKIIHYHSELVFKNLIPSNNVLSIFFGFMTVSSMTFLCQREAPVPCGVCTICVLCHAWPIENEIEHEPRALRTLARTIKYVLYRQNPSAYFESILTQSYFYDLPSFQFTWCRLTGLILCSTILTLFFRELKGK